MTSFDVSHADVALSVRQTRFAWLLWGGFTLAASTMIALATDRSPVNVVYRHGADCWSSGRELYDGGGTVFIYPPQAAILHLPFTLLPRPAYDFAWRIVNLGLFGWGVYQLARCAQGNAHRGLYLWATLFVLPKTWTVAVNGQATTAMAGLMMIAAAAASSGKWTRAAVSLILALAFKPLAIVLVLLMGALHPPLRWRLALGSLVFLGFPYLTQEASYVTAQYRDFLSSLEDSAALGLSIEWPQLFSLLQWVGIQLSESAQTFLRGMAAVATLAAAWWVTRRFDRGDAAVLIYSLAASYLLLFNPRTENSSYTLLMPAVGICAARAIVRERCWRRVAWLTVLALGLTGGYEICRLFTPEAPFVWTCPLATAAFAAWLAIEIIKSRPAAPEEPAGEVCGVDLQTTGRAA
ncbi:MAG: glycosyltransferase family 87 protein [Planctomycetales bacterium]